MITKCHDLRVGQFHVMLKKKRKKAGSKTPPAVPST